MSLCARLVFLLSAAALVGAETPKFQWWQDQDALHLSIDTKRCDSAVGTADISDRSFKWSCSDKLSLEFDLREPVIPDQSSCKVMSSARGPTEQCKLQKLLPHHFDRLTASKTPGALKRYMHVDWSRSTSTPPEQLYSEPYEDEEDRVPTVSANELEEHQADRVLVVADVMYPWCDKNPSTPKAVIEAAGKLRRNSKVGFVYINAVDYPELSRSLNLGCEAGKNKLQLYRQGEPRFELDASTPDLVKTVKQFLRPAAKSLVSQAELDKASTNNTMVVGFLSGSADSEAGREFLAAARRLQVAKSSVSSSVVYPGAWDHTSQFGSMKLPFLVGYRDGVKESVSESVEWSASSIAKWAKIHTAPALTKFDYSLTDTLEQLGLPIAQVWPSEDGKQQPKLLELAEQYRGRVVFVEQSKDSSYLMDDFGFGGKDLSTKSAFGLAGSLKYDDKLKYGFDGDDLTSPELPTFIEAYLDGKLSASLKSQVVPEEVAVPGVLNTVVAKNLGQVSSEKTTVIVLYKPWGEDWKLSVDQALSSVASLLKDVDSLQFVKMDTSRNAIDASVLPGVDEHHATAELLIRKHNEASATKIWKSGEFSEYPGTKMNEMRTSVLEYLKQASQEVQQTWGSVESMLVKEAEEKKAAEEAAKKAQKDKYAKARHVEVTAGIDKFVFAEGDGESPQVGDEVTAHYTGTLENGDKFDSSVDRGEPFKFTLGRGQVIKCWDQGFATMKKGEKADLKCDSNNGYGDRGSPPKIPGGATLIFDVELISFKPNSAKADL